MQNVQGKMKNDDVVSAMCILHFSFFIRQRYHFSTQSTLAIVHSFGNSLKHVSPRVQNPLRVKLLFDAFEQHDGVVAAAPG